MNCEKGLKKGDFFKRLIILIINYIVAIVSITFLAWMTEPVHKGTWWNGTAVIVGIMVLLSVTLWLAIVTNKFLFPKK